MSFKSTAVALAVFGAVSAANAAPKAQPHFLKTPGASTAGMLGDFIVEFFPERQPKGSQLGGISVRQHERKPTPYCFSVIVSKLGNPNSIPPTKDAIAFRQKLEGKGGNSSQMMILSGLGEDYLPGTYKALVKECDADDNTGIAEQFAVIE